MFIYCRTPLAPLQIYRKVRPPRMPSNTITGTIFTLYLNTSQTWMIFTPTEVFEIFSQFWFYRVTESPIGFHRLRQRRYSQRRYSPPPRWSLFFLILVLQSFTDHPSISTGSGDSATPPIKSFPCCLIHKVNALPCNLHSTCAQ